MPSRLLKTLLWLALPSAAALAQAPVTTVQPPGAPSPTPDYPSGPFFAPPSSSPSPTPDQSLSPPVTLAPDTTPDDTGNSLAPSWDTQRQARTYVLQVPAPRGQITDPRAAPSPRPASVTISSSISPSRPPMSDPETLDFAHSSSTSPRSSSAAPSPSPTNAILKHYHNRGLLPLDIALDLIPTEIDTVKQQPLDHLSLQPVYERFYPNGPMAGQILGYVGRSGRTADGPVIPNEELWPVSEGREGLELTFNAQLTGKNGQLNLTFDTAGQKASEKIVIPPQPGANVVTTLDADIQRITEAALDKGAKRGAIVIVDATNGDIVAMASKPCYNPNDWVPTISPEVYNALKDDPDIPLFPRAFRSSYPPGSTFKVPVGIAALESGAIKLSDVFPGPPSIQIGGLTFHNWKKTDAGMLDFVDALTQSCDTWFYQVGIKTGADPIIGWAQKMGFGQKTGIPLAAEAEGRVPTQDYMQRVYGRKFSDGDMANFSIGQGDLLVTPLQMAEAMAAVGNGGTLYRARLVQQVETYNSQLLTAYNVEVKQFLGIDPHILDAVRQGMINVVESPAGTAGKAAIDEVQIAGKTGTAQWGSKARERDAAWFVGFCPADHPKYAFAALYEGEIGESTHGGTYAAPMIADIMKQLFKPPPAVKKSATTTSHHRAQPAQTETND